MTNPHIDDGEIRRLASITNDHDLIDVPDALIAASMIEDKIDGVTAQVEELSTSIDQLNDTIKNIGNRLIDVLRLER